MRIPLTSYGWPQVVTLPVMIIIAMILVLLPGLNLFSLWTAVSIEAILFILLVFVLAFFRDPNRQVSQENNLLLAPADGTIADIELIQANDYIDSPCLKVGIFLSIFNTHINRSPCPAKVEQITYKKGQYKDARHPLAGKVNESNEIRLTKADKPEEKLIVKQISGAIARRIVCKLQPGQILTSGEKFGMIKFGSRTELYVPASEKAKCLVQVGDKVKAGITAIIRYE
jgi:phosphatidylserine decarboxylase